MWPGGRTIHNPKWEVTLDKYVLSWCQVLEAFDTEDLLCCLTLISADRLGKGGREKRRVLASTQASSVQKQGCGPQVLQLLLLSVENEISPSSQLHHFSVNSASGFMRNKLSCQFCELTF